LLAAEGASVIVADVLEAAGAAQARGLGPAAEFVYHDTAQAESWAQLIAHVDRQHGRLDALINNAAVFTLGDVETFDEADCDRLYRINQLGYMLGMRAAAPQLIATRGSIVNVASTAGIRGFPGRLAYASVKWAVRGMTRAAAADLAPHGVRVNCVVPGLMDTSQVRGNPPEILERFVQSTPLSRIASPVEVARATVFLASRDASYVTGVDFIVDGGATI
jgi:3alpha(or 20beta)-hydroxysteroid dehydrogenase